MDNMNRQSGLKRRMKLIIRFLAFCAVLFVLLSSATQVLMMKNSEKKLKRFFDKREDFDVLFTGISHMQMGVSPMELWNEYGIASFNLAQSFERLILGAADGTGIFTSFPCRHRRAPNI